MRKGNEIAIRTRTARRGEAPSSGGTRNDGRRRPASTAPDPAFWEIAKRLHIRIGWEQALTTDS